MNVFQTCLLFPIKTMQALKLLQLLPVELQEPLFIPITNWDEENNLNDISLVTWTFEEKKGYVNFK